MRLAKVARKCAFCESSFAGLKHGGRRRCCSKVCLDALDVREGLGGEDYVSECQHAQCIEMGVGFAGYCSSKCFLRNLRDQRELRERDDQLRLLRENNCGAKYLR